MSKKKPKKISTAKNKAVNPPQAKKLLSSKKQSKVIWPDIAQFSLSTKVLFISILVAFAFSFAQYGQTLPYEFVLDDQIVVSENSFVKQGFAGIDDLLLTESFVGYFGEQKDLIPGARYRPLSLITFAIEYGFIGKLNSTINHLVNIILYALCGWLVFLSLAKLFPAGKKWWFSIPFLAFIIWIVHPVHSEAVANIKGRDEIMSLVFSLLCLLLSIRLFEKEKTSIGGLIGLALLFFLGLLSKENTITLLAIIPATLYMFRKPNPRIMWGIVGAMFISFVAYLVLRHTAVGYFFSGKEVTDIMNDPFLGMGFMERMATVLYVLLKYIGLSFVPYPLTHDYYPFQIPRVGWFNIFVLLSLVFHVALALFSIINFRKRSTWAYIIFFYIAALSIYSNILINVGTTMNERFLFVPTVASSLAIVYGIHLAQKKYDFSSWIKVGVVGIIAIIYFLIAFNRTQVWENALTLNTAAVKISTNSARSNSFMATALFENAKDMQFGPEKTQILQEAMVYADKATKLLPNYYNANLMKVGIAGELYKMDNNLPSLLSAFKEVAIERPDVNFIHEYLEYISDRNIDDEVMYRFFYSTGYEELVLNKKNYDWGIKFLNYGRDLRPNSGEIHWAISKAYEYKGDQANANNYMSKALQLDPSLQNR